MLERILCQLGHGCFQLPSPCFNCLLPDALIAALDDGQLVAGSGVSTLLDPTPPPACRYMARSRRVCRRLSPSIVAASIPVSRPACTSLSTINRFCSLLFNVTLSIRVTFSLFPYGVSDSLKNNNPGRRNCSHLWKTQAKL